MSQRRSDDSWFLARPQGFSSPWLLEDVTGSGAIRLFFGFLKWSGALGGASVFLPRPMACPYRAASITRFRHGRRSPLAWLAAGSFCADRTSENLGRFGSAGWL